MYGDDFITALTIWRENRGGAYVGMQSVCNVIQHRVQEHNSSFYEECIKPWQFTSMTGKGDPELTLYPAANDPLWISAQQIVEQAIAGTLPDLTDGADLYYNPQTIAAGQHQMFTLPDNTQIAFPESWNPTVVKYLTSIAGHVFFKQQ